MKAIALFSGGLDSILAIRILQEQGIEVLAYTFVTPFFGPEAALAAKDKLGIQVRTPEITDIYMEILKTPRYGYGKNMNPCIDCHGLMFRKAGELLKVEGVDFLISGEVLGQRPMSQRYDALNSVGKLSQVKDLLVRPLSQKLLVDTLPVREGWVKKADMLDIQGRGRHRQMALAAHYGIIEYQNPGGGCLLTDKGFSQRLKDLMEHDIYHERQIELIKTGRHFRLSKDCKLIVGKNNRDNEMIGKLAGDDIVLQTKNFPGPLGLLIGSGKNTENLAKAAAIVLRYNNKAPVKSLVSYGTNYNLKEQILF